MRWSTGSPARADVRLLFIKGPTAVAQGLRAPRESLGRRRTRRPGATGTISPSGSPSSAGWTSTRTPRRPCCRCTRLTHRHHAWPNELDLHDRFPGFFADAAGRLRAAVGAAQDRQRRRPRDPLPRPGRAGARAGPAHASRPARPEQGPRAGLPRRAGHGHRDRRLAARPRGAGARPRRGGHGGAVPRPGRRTRGRARQHRLRPTCGPGSCAPSPTPRPAVSWVHELRQLPWRRRPRYLWYAAFLSDVELRLAEPNLPPGRGPLLHARIRRLRRGLRAVPSAVRSVHAVERAPRDKRP